ncbi:MAG TPA: hypothetical protein VFI72_13415 [Candidatus Angelobacter sp.]|nr:hypothetical protein [Candidatus Angelobacter sp.]
MTGITTRFRAVANLQGTPPALSVFLLLLTLTSIPGSGFQSWSSGQAQSEDLGLLRRASQNEVTALEHPSQFTFFERLRWNWGSETREVIETAQGRADRVVAFDDEPLAPNQVARQVHRLSKLLKDPHAVHDEIKDQQEETERRIRMMKVFPDAFLFEPAGEEDDGTRIFRFRPNPKFSPHDRETQVYRGMQGKVWVDPQAERLTRIDGVLTKDVSFGWGVLGKLYKGGRYQIQQEQVSPGEWRITSLNLELRGRMLFNSFRVLREETDSEFRHTPRSVTYTEAVEQLLRSPAGPARERVPGQSGSRGRSH